MKVIEASENIEKIKVERVELVRERPQRCNGASETSPRTLEDVVTGGEGDAQ